MNSIKFWHFGHSKKKIASQEVSFSGFFFNHIGGDSNVNWGGSPIEFDLSTSSEFNFDFRLSTVGYWNSLALDNDGKIFEFRKYLGIEIIAPNSDFEFVISDKNSRLLGSKLKSVRVGYVPNGLVDNRSSCDFYASAFLSITDVYFVGTFDLEVIHLPTGFTCGKKDIVYTVSIID